MVFRVFVPEQSTEVVHLNLALKVFVTVKPEIESEAVNEMSV
jgi:hypothetical protein